MGDGGSGEAVQGQCTLVWSQMTDNLEGCHSNEFRLLSASGGQPVQVFEKGIWKMLLVTFDRKISVWGRGRAEAEGHCALHSHL